MELSYISDIPYSANLNPVRSEVSTAVKMKNGVFCDVTPCGSCKNLDEGVAKFLRNIGS
jgi:hypothetical protein